jgi:hypothetical protein
MTPVDRSPVLPPPAPGPAADESRPDQNRRWAVIFALFGCALMGGTLAAWYANGRPVDAQSRIWYLPLGTAGYSFAAAFVNAVASVVNRRPRDP